jgi:hypothetical protein
MLPVSLDFEWSQIQNPETQATLVTDSKSNRKMVEAEKKINMYMAAQSQSLVQVLRKQIDQSQYSNVVV